MKKQFSVFAMLMLLSVFSAYAGGDTQKEKVVTTRLAFVSGSGSVSNHYLSDQEYNGSLMGAAVEFGSFYKRNENLSWDLDLTYISAPYSSYLP